MEDILTLVRLNRLSFLIRTIRFDVIPSCLPSVPHWYPTPVLVVVLFSWIDAPFLEGNETLDGIHMPILRLVIPAMYPSQAKIKLFTLHFCIPCDILEVALPHYVQIDTTFPDIPCAYPMPGFSSGTTATGPEFHEAPLLLNR